MVCFTAVTVIVTGMMTLSGGLVLASVTVPEYVPGATFDGSARIPIEVDANALTPPPAGVATSHAPPDVVAVTAEKFSEPPPTFDTERFCERAAAPCTKENVKEFGLTLRLAAPGAV